MRKDSYLNRLISLILVAVMLLSLVIFDGSFGTKAENVTSLSITATLTDATYAEDLTDETGYIYVDKKSLDAASPSDASVKLRLDITSDATSTDALKVTYTYTAEDTSSVSAEKDATKESDNNFYVTLEGAGTYIFKVEYNGSSVTTTRVVKYVESDSPEAVTTDSSPVIVIETTSDNTSYNSFDDYNTKVTSSTIWCKSLKTLNLVFNEKNTFFKSATVTYEIAGNVAKNGSNELFSEEDINGTSYNFSAALDAINDLDDGQYKLTFTTTSYLEETESVYLYLYLDKTAPVITLTGSSVIEADVTKYNVSEAKGETIIVSFEDTDSGIYKTEVTVNDSELTAETDGTYKCTFGGTGTYTDVGTYTIGISSTDNAGNVSTRKLEVTVVDDEAPEITNVDLGSYTAYSDGIYYYTDYPTFKVSASDTNELDSVIIKDSNGNAIYTSESLSNSIKSNDFEVSLTSSIISLNTEYTVIFYAKDKAGNISEDTNATTYTYKIVVDKEAPTVIITNSIDYWNKTDVSLNVKAGDTVCLNKLEVTATCNGENLGTETIDLTGKEKTESLTYSNEGVYEVSIYAYDVAGNKSEEAKTSFVIDKTAPVITITGIPSNGIYRNNGSETITVKAADTYGISADDVTITLYYETYDGATSGSEVITGSADTGSKNVTATIKNCEIIDNKPMKYYFVVTAKDKSGNEAETYKSTTFYYDVTAPDLTVSPDITGSGTVYYNSNVSFTIGVTEQFALGTNIYILDATDYKSCDDEDDYKANAYNSFELKNKTLGSFTQKVTDEGTYNWVIVAVDAFGNEKAVKNIKFIIDKTNPVAEVQGVPDNGLSTGTTVSIIITDNETLDADSFTVTGYWKYYDASTYNKVNVSVESTGSKTLKASMYCGEKNNKACSYYFTVTGYDRAGNAVEYTVSDSNLKVDATAPTVTISPLPEETNDGYYNSSVSFTISVTEQYSNTTTIKVSDANKATNGDDDETYYLKDTNGTFTVKRNSQGIYNLKITVTDAFGNETVKTVNFVIDKTNPEIVIGAVNKLNNGNVSLKVNITDNYKGKSYRVHVVRKNSSGTVVYEEDVLNEEWNNKSVSPTLSFTDEGDYTVTVYSTDKAGNEAEIDSATFRIDKTAPVLSITGVNDTQTTDCTATFSINEAFAFNFDGNSLSSSDISVTITKKTDGSAETTVATLNATNFSSANPHTASYSFSEDGEYTITFTAKDLSGNTAATVTKTFKVDKTAPEILVSAVNNSNVEVSSYEVVGGNDESDADYVSMKITVNETFFASNNVTIKVTKNGVDVSKDYFVNFGSTSATSTGSQEFLEDGVYTIDITAVDALGNAAEAYNLVFTIDNTAPTIEATEKLTGFMSRMTDDGDLLLNSSDFADILNMGYEALWDVNDTSVFDVVVKLDGVDFVDFTDLTDGYHTMTITVTDEVGHVTSQEFSFTYDGTAPRIIITGVEDGDVVREAFTMTISLEDEDDYITSIVINGETIDPSLYEDTNVYEYQVEEYGDYEVVVYAEDVAGNTASTYNNETGEAFSFSYRQHISIVLIIIIIIVAILLILLIILLIRRYRNKRKDKDKNK